MAGYRAYADCLASLQACIRDQYVECQGLKITAMLPIDSSGDVKPEVDFYGDYCPTNRVDKVMYLIPIYDEYYTLLDLLGEDLEDPLPLECIVKAADNWPRDTIFKLPVMNNEGQLIDRYWRVLSEQQKHLDISYSRKIKVVPAREHEIEGID